MKIGIDAGGTLIKVVLLSDLSRTFLKSILLRNRPGH